jgi:hypothetical protein
MYLDLMSARVVSPYIDNLYLKCGVKMQNLMSRPDSMESILGPQIMKETCDGFNSFALDSSQSLY